MFVLISVRQSQAFEIGKPISSEVKNVYYEITVVFVEGTSTPLAPWPWCLLNALHPVLLLRRLSTSSAHSFTLRSL